MTESEERAKRLYSLLEVTDRSFKDFWAMTSSEELKPYWVVNTTGYRKIFLAENEELALFVAAHEGHLRNYRNGSSALVSEDYLARNLEVARAVAEGIEDQNPGSLSRAGHMSLDESEGGEEEAQKAFPPLRLVR